MSDIVINSENFKRFSKRLQKSLRENDCNKTLMESQEILAKVLGSSNTFELMKNLAPEEKLIVNVIDNIEYVKKAQLFLSELSNLLVPDSSGNSTIKACFFEVIHENSIVMTIVSEKIVKDKYCFYFGEETNDYKIYEELIYAGFGRCDSDKIQEFKLKNIPSNAKESILLAYEVLKILQEASNLNETKKFDFIKYQPSIYNNFFILKMKPGVNEIKVKGIYFEKKYSLVSNKFFRKDKEVFFDDSKRFLDISDYDNLKDLAAWEDKDISIKQLDKDFSSYESTKILIEYYTEMFSYNGRKICKQYWKYDKHGVLINHQVN